MNVRDRAPTAFNWATDPRGDVLLRALWPSDLHLNEVLAELRARLRCQSLTKNAMCGRAHRIGLPSRRPESARKPRPSDYKPRSHKRKEPVALSPVVIAQGSLTPPPYQHRHQCRWPIGEPREKGFRFCDEQAEPGRPYCEAHVAVAYYRQPKKKEGEEQQAE
jgi:GcrA cell cycle regulator